jgi:hypothetical protein
MENNFSNEETNIELNIEPNTEPNIDDEDINLLEFETDESFNKNMTFLGIYNQIYSILKIVFMFIPIILFSFFLFIIKVFPTGAYNEIPNPDTLITVIIVFLVIAIIVAIPLTFSIIKEYKAGSSIKYAIKTKDNKYLADYITYTSDSEKIFFIIIVFPLAILMILNIIGIFRSI